MRSEVTKLPELFLDRLKGIFPPRRYHELVNTFAFKKPVSFRVNTNLITIPRAKEEFASSRLKVFPVSWYQGAYTTNYPIQKLQKLSLYTDGRIYVQRLSSMIPPLVLKPQKDQIVLDMTSAPGSKTLQMANMMQNQGLIMAYEISKIRVERLLYNISLQGAKNITVRMKDATEIWKEYPEYFDKILLDAPCSSEGRFYINEPDTYKYWSENLIANLSHLQKKLIASALVSLKIGGEMVYATCTFAPEENEGVIDWVVQMVGDKVTIEEPHLKISNIGPPVVFWKGKNFTRKVTLTKRILPDKYLEGFFISKIRKIKKINV